MSTELLDPAEVDFASSQRSLLLVWQDPESRRFVKVGRLDFLADNRFAFRYLESEEPNGFTLDDYPYRDTAYVSESLPAFFANRVMSSSRPSYSEYLGWLGIEDIAQAELPVEVLARTGGERQTDTFHILDMPEELDSSFSSRFFVSGVRHVEASEQVLAALEPGASLSLVLEETNQVNPSAVVINTVDGSKVGYVPDWLCGDISSLITAGWQVTATAERVNRDAPSHVKVLCKVDAQRN